MINHNPETMCASLHYRLTIANYHLYWINSLGRVYQKPSPYFQSTQGNNLRRTSLTDCNPSSPPVISLLAVPRRHFVFWFFMVVLLSICLWYVSIMATCIAVHFAVCHALYNNKNKKIGKNRCLVFLNELNMFCNVILSL